MPKIPGWSRDYEHPFPKWVHDETGQEIEVGPGDRADYRKDGNPKKYQITVWNGTNNRIRDFGITSKEEAKRSAMKIAKENPDGEIIETIRERYG